MAAGRGAVIAAEFVALRAAALAQTRAGTAVIALATIDRLAREAGCVLKLANAAGRNGMNGFVFCDLPDLAATSGAGRMVLTVQAGVAAVRVRGIKRGGDRVVAARQSAARRERAIMEAEPLGGQLGPMVAAGMRGEAMAQVLARVGKVSSPGKPLAPAAAGGILQRLGPAGKPHAH